MHNVNHFLLDLNSSLKVDFSGNIVIPISHSKQNTTADVLDFVLRRLLQFNRKCSARSKMGTDNKKLEQIGIKNCLLSSLCYGLPDEKKLLNKKKSIGLYFKTK